MNSTSNLVSLIQSTTDIPSGYEVKVFVAENPFSEQSLSEIFNNSNEFFENWRCHSKYVDGVAWILDNQIFIIGSNTKQISKLSGCSMDARLHFVSSLEQSLEMSIINSGKIFAKSSEASRIQSYSRREFIDHFSSVDESSLEESLVVNTMISHSDQLHDELIIPINHSWHAKLLKKLH